MKTFINTCLILSALVITLVMPSCRKAFLDIVPDNVPTLDNAFANRNEAEKYLFTCYSALPNDASPDFNPGMNTGDEFWVYSPVQTTDYTSLEPFNIAQGLQSKVNPAMNYWDGSGGGKSLWQGIRNCNIFLENIDKPIDLQPYEKDRWIAEVKFLKAYLHWYLFRMYGPIPIVDKNLPINASPAEVKVFRQPVDSVVSYISNLLDEAAAGEGTGLPDKITSLSTELGRVTKPAALAIKARLLVTAASPLFNGNPDFSSLKNKDGKALFNPVYDGTKWQRAAAACKAAIDAAEAAGAGLYQFIPGGLQVADSATKIEMSIRNAVCEKWNKELIFGLTASTRYLQMTACPNLFAAPQFDNGLRGQLAPTLKMAELFYTKNGVPINEDKTWDYENRFVLKTITARDSAMQNGYQTVGLHFEREPRFYADMAFDGSKMYMQSNQKPPVNIQSKLEQVSGKKQNLYYSISGYYTKKLINWNLVVGPNGGTTTESYPWPVMRLGDLYLLYAEALNESGDQATPLTYLNRIRERAGLPTVESAWTNFSTNPGKYSSQAGLREIIHQERLIEMAFEGSRFWDLRRWKKAANLMNAPVYGWNVGTKTFADYNTRLLLFNQTFVSPRDYFWPIKESNLQVNTNLVQNPGW
ncbi:RagB/SusD family nutrient uptake outer membrane protein [Niabella drilacis]|uniref:Starch-binding associating with outer membrane n=1 Tax=Niabella drilacis (strain DSM 25811 / CCM 8410 / CCUG 62505 / LMG 26954 / E90) TaxID=1285928 RepID=A0A1G6X3V1_NIADE|nr:RagB/SusD family nutrient uptake outer membrane protein [Niabella drilacis]SDD72788.1 Starch-binding associating with outer membrane [Niabella drilacis]